MQACPKCERIDKVRKVSGIVSEGTTHGSSSSGASVSTTSDLAQRLRLPAIPTVTRPGGCSLIILVLAVAWAIFELAIITILLIAMNNSGIARQFSIPPEALSMGNVGSLAPLLLVGLVIAGLVFAYRRSGKKRAIQQEQAVVSWRYMQIRWEKAFYCGRCDIVYIENEQGSAPVSKFLSFLASKN